MKRKRNFSRENIEVMKSQGTSISRSVMKGHDIKFYKENESVISECQREMRVLRMKRHFLKKNWAWPPRQHHIASICHLINVYYGKELVKHVPKDNLEKLIKEN